MLLTKAQLEFLESRKQPTLLGEFIFEKEKREVINKLKAHGGFKGWLDAFNRAKFDSFFTQWLTYQELQEIYLFLYNKLPLTNALERAVNRAWYRADTEVFHKRFVERNPGSAEVIALAKAIVYDPEYNQYCPKALEITRRLCERLEAYKKLSGGELDAMKNELSRLADPRMITAGYILFALRDAGLTNTKNATTAGTYMIEKIQGLLDRFCNHGLTQQNISDILDDGTLPNGGRKISLVTRFQNELRDVILRGEVKKYTPPSRIVHVEEDENKKEPVYVTEEGLQRMQEKLNYLRVTRRKEVAERLKEARSLGDLSENAEYDAARAEQAMLEAEIQELEDLISRAEIIKDKSNQGVVSVGSVVVIRDLKEKVNLTIRLIPPAEVRNINLAEEKETGIMSLSAESPIGIALIGKTKGKIVAPITPEGKRYLYKIVDIL